MFFTLRPERGWLNDKSYWSTIVFQEVRDHPLDVWNELRKFSEWIYEGGEERYYLLRDEYQTLDGPRRAAAQMTLATCGFNGLTRFDGKGKWNVSWGKRFAPGTSRDFQFIRQFPYELIQYYSSLLKRATITISDFEEVIASTDPSDFIYCDPPYLEKNGGYISTWSIEDEIRLRESLIEFGDRGGHWAVSEMASRDGERFSRIDEVWGRFKMHETSYKYTVGTNKSKTQDVEVLILGPEMGGPSLHPRPPYREDPLSQLASC